MPTLECQAAIGLLAEGFQLDIGHHIDPLGKHLVHQGLAEHGVEILQQLLTAQQQADIAAQSGQHTGQFHGDIAGTHDRHLPGQSLQGEETVRGDAQLGTGDIRYHRYAAG